MNTPKKVFSTELAYFFGIFALAIGTSLMTTADFGVSMVVAPAYILHLKFSQALPFFSFGMAEYSLQAILLLFTAAVMRRFKWSYLFSFITAVFYGITLDGCLFLVRFLTADLSNTLFLRLLFYVVGLLFCSVGVSFFFHTYISPAAYELFVKELSERLHINIHKFKTGYDCVSCLISILLSFLFFGLWHFEGVKLGTVLCALINGFLIGKCTAFLDRRWRFEDKFPLRGFFAK